MKRREAPAFDHRMQLNIPQSLNDAVGRAALAKLQTMNAYVRGAIMEQLRKDGVKIGVVEVRTDGGRGHQLSATS